jgi:carbon starvation protein
MGKLRYIWVSLLPLAWVLSVTLTAGYQKIFAPDTRLGFLSAANELSSKVTHGGSASQLAMWNQQIFNAHVNSFVTATFLVLVILIVSANARVWWQILITKNSPPLQEDAPTGLSPEGSADAHA